jgi:hypothetical protein
MYEIFEKQWLSDFNQILVEIMENNDAHDGKYIHFIAFLERTSDPKAKNILKTFCELCKKTVASFAQSDLPIELVETFNRSQTNSILMIRYLKNYVENGKFPTSKKQRKEIKRNDDLDYEGIVRSMLAVENRLNEVLEFVKKVLGDNDLYTTLDRGVFKTALADLTTNKNKTTIKKLEQWIKFKESNKFIVKTLKVASNDLFRHLFRSLGNDKLLEPTQFERQLQQTWKLFEEHLKKATKGIDKRSEEGLRQTVQEISAGKYDGQTDLFDDLTSIELRGVVHNYQILGLMGNRELLEALVGIMQHLKSIGKIEEDHRTSQFIQSVHAHLPRFYEKQEFLRDESIDVGSEEVGLLGFVAAHQQLVIELSKWWPLLDHFRRKNYRHFEELLIYRDTAKYASISNETIGKLRLVIDTFNSKDRFASLVDFCRTMEQSEGDIRSLRISEGTFESLIECSEEMATEETGLSKIESILNDSRIMFLCKEQGYVILVGLSRPEEEGFDQTKSYLVEGADRGKQSFSFEMMQDYKIRLSFAPEDGNLEAKRRHYISLMASLEGIREALNKVKARGYVRDLKGSFHGKLDRLHSESREKERIEYSRGTINIKSGDVLIKVRSTRTLGFRTDNAELIGAGVQGGAAGAGERGVGGAAGEPLGCEPGGVPAGNGGRLPEREGRADVLCGAAGGLGGGVGAGQRGPGTGSRRCGGGEEGVYAGKGRGEGDGQDGHRVPGEGVLLGTPERVG